MKKLSLLSLLIITSVATVVVYAGCYLLYDQIRSKNEGISLTLNNIDYEIEKAETASTLKTLVADTKNQRDSLEALIVKDEAVADFAGSIEALSKITGADTTINSLGKISSGDSLFNTEQFVISLGVDGDWSSLRRTLALIESLPYAASVDNVAFSRDRTPVDPKKSLVIKHWQGSLSFRVLKYQQ